MLSLRRPQLFIDTAWAFCHARINIVRGDVDVLSKSSLPTAIPSGFATSVSISTSTKLSSTNSTEATTGPVSDDALYISSCTVAGAITGSYHHHTITGACTNRSW